MTEIGPTGFSSRPGLRKYFYGAYGLRSGWRLLFFIAILAILLRVDRQFVQPLMGGLDDVTQYLANCIVNFLDFLLASWIMAKIERKTIAAYGLPWRRMFQGQFWRGALLGFASLTMLLVIMRASGIFYFGKVGLHAAEGLRFAGLYGLAFIIVGVREEFNCRGYGLFALSQGIGFWPAAFLTSAFFGYMHLDNSGETWLGLFNVAAGGMFFCFLLRRTGNLWMPIGFHMAWDWAETYFYGVPDSGQVVPGHLFNGSFSGPAWLTGGSVGPEGSVFCTVFLAALCFVLNRWLREAKYPAPDAVLVPESALQNSMPDLMLDKRLPTTKY
jgi:membrane protease YdiL (CAAX protease family)